MRILPLPLVRLQDIQKLLVRIVLVVGVASLDLVQVLDRVVELWLRSYRGWPIAVRLAIQVAQEGRGSRLLLKSGRIVGWVDG
jgi:hypothetical protein